MRRVRIRSRLQWLYSKQCGSVEKMLMTGLECILLSKHD